MTFLSNPGGFKGPQYNGLNYPVQTVEYLVVAGGGGGGSGYDCGGGGAGGYLSATNLAVAIGTSYTITVGAGGAPVSNSTGSNGTNSLFGTLVNGSTGAVGGCLLYTSPSPRD